jgi:hypothetical protein
VQTLTAKCLVVGPVLTCVKRVSTEDKDCEYFIGALLMVAIPLFMTHTFFYA